MGGDISSHCNEHTLSGDETLSTTDILLYCDRTQLFCLCQRSSGSGQLTGLGITMFITTLDDSAITDLRAALAGMSTLCYLVSSFEVHRSSPECFLFLERLFLDLGSVMQYFQ